MHGKERIRGEKGRVMERKGRTRGEEGKYRENCNRKERRWEHRVQTDGKKGLRNEWKRKGEGCVSMMLL